MAFTLSVNTNPLVNRFAEPDDLIDTIAYDIRLKYVQLTHEFVNPGWPAATIRRFVRAFNRATARTGVEITSGMTGPYGRLNHFGHPDRDVRRYYVDWFKTFADICADLGARSVGTQFAILTLKDFDDPRRREELTRIAIDCWGEVAEHAKEAGLSYVFWEPMSVGREFGETIAACGKLQDRLDAAGFAIPMWMMVDIDHGDVTSSEFRRRRSLCLGARLSDALADHPRQAVVDEQGRPLAVHGEVQCRRTDPAGQADRGGARRRRRRQRDLPRTVVPGARADGPGRRAGAAGVRRVLVGARGDGRIRVARRRSARRHRCRWDRAFVWCHG